MMEAADLQEAIKVLEFQKGKKLEQIKNYSDSITEYIEKGNTDGVSICIQNLIRIEQELIHIVGQLEAYGIVQFQMNYKPSTEGPLQREK